MQRLKKELRKELSKFIRKRDTDRKGNALCISCKQEFNADKMDCGHFISSKHESVRYEPQNIWLQCRKCNGQRGGNRVNYEINLRQILGDAAVDNLIYMSNQIAKFTKEDIEEKIRRIRELSNEL